MYEKYLNEYTKYRCFRPKIITVKTLNGIRNIRSKIFGIFDMMCITEQNNLLIIFDLNYKESTNKIVNKIVEFAMSAYFPRFGYELIRYNWHTEEWTEVYITMWDHWELYFEVDEIIRKYDKNFNAIGYEAKTWKEYNKNIKYLSIRPAKYYYDVKTDDFYIKYRKDDDEI